MNQNLKFHRDWRDLGETMSQAEKAFAAFFSTPPSKKNDDLNHARTEISKQALSFTERNMKAAFDHARKLVHATDLQEAMRDSCRLFCAVDSDPSERMDENHRPRGYGGEGRDQGQVLAIDYRRRAVALPSQSTAAESGPRLP